MSEKSEALRLAEFCDGNVLYQPAAAELRRLAAVEAQRDALLERADTLQRWYDQQLDSLAAIESQRDALLEALRAMLEQFNYHTITGIVHDESAAIAKARAAIKAVGEGK